MFLDTLRVKTKLKFSVPSAGLEMPSIFCRTHGPICAVVVLPAVIVCQGHANRTCGRCTLKPRKCSIAESAIKTTEAITRRKIRPTRMTTALLLTHRGTQRRRGRDRCGGPGGQPLGGPGARAAPAAPGSGSCQAGGSTPAGLAPPPGPPSCPPSSRDQPPVAPEAAQADSAAASLRLASELSRRISNRTIGLSPHPSVAGRAHGRVNGGRPG